ncbi:CREB/ATF bZIP transcription factor [Passer montanus]|uniref:CREB/ATF bZIP transcription factor n=1 Tax=Passer montanus TaxID=9160 RepID=UPI0019605E05|nr:CREB/ATF bZIP transcription factor [Passer montanus]
MPHLVTFPPSPPPSFPEAAFPRAGAVARRSPRAASRQAARGSAGRRPGASEPRRQEKEAEAPGGPLEVWEQEDWFPGLELGDLLEAARPDWDLDAELSDCFCGEPEPLPAPGKGPRPAAPGRRSGGAGSRLKAAAAARLNRLKKKQYVLGLESRLQGLAAENRQLRDRNRGLSRRLRELERESSYLRAVLANQSALGQLLSRLAGTRAGGLQLSTSLFRDTGSRQQQQQLQPAGESSDHDYALPSSRPRGLEEAAAVTETEEEWAAPGGICLHVDRDQVSVEFCSICARRAAASFKIFSFRWLPCQAPLCRG